MAHTLTLTLVVALGGLVASLHLHLITGLHLLLIGKGRTLVLEHGGVCRSLLLDESHGVARCLLGDDTLNKLFDGRVCLALSFADTGLFLFVAPFVTIQPGGCDGRLKQVDIFVRLVAEGLLLQPIERMHRFLHSSLLELLLKLLWGHSVRAPRDP
jgi:hypothetical protein